MGEIYSTLEIAREVKVHPNTVRLYEEWGYLHPVPRNKNGYRQFNKSHLEQMRLARIALRCEFIQGNIRKKAASIVKLAAQGDLKEALAAAKQYLDHIKNEKKNAEEAVKLIQNYLKCKPQTSPGPLMSRKEVAVYLGVSIDVLRNWELNGLITVPRNPQNGYRVYGNKEINRLKIIKTLREANYSLMSILRMLRYVDCGGRKKLQVVLDTPGNSEDIVDATDRWAATLQETEEDALELINQLGKMIKN